MIREEQLIFRTPQMLYMRQINQKIKQIGKYINEQYVNFNKITKTTGIN